VFTVEGKTWRCGFSYSRRSGTFIRCSTSKRRGRSWRGQSGNTTWSSYRSTAREGAGGRCGSSDAEEESWGRMGKRRPVRAGPVDAGADLCWGTVPTSRAPSRCTRKMIAYSLGNFAVTACSNIKGPSGSGTPSRRSSTGTGDVGPVPHAVGRPAPPRDPNPIRPGRRSAAAHAVGGVLAGEPRRRRAAAKPYCACGSNSFSSRRRRLAPR